MTGTVVTGPFVRSSPFYNHEVPQPRIDPDSARTFMEQAGFANELGVRVGADGLLVLRREIRRMVTEGQSEREIKTFLVERYGDFVLYKPLFRSWNLLPISTLMTRLKTRDCRRFNHGSTRG